MHIPSIKDTSSIAMSPVNEEPLIPSKIIYITINDCWLVLRILLIENRNPFVLMSHMQKDGLTSR